MNDYPYGNDPGRGPYESSSGVNVNVGGFMIGAIVGAGLALLLAPASGGETRRRIGDTARKLGSAARDKFEDLKSSASGVAEDLKAGAEAARETYSTGRMPQGSSDQVATPRTAQPGIRNEPGRGTNS